MLLRIYELICIKNLNLSLTCGNKIIIYLKQKNKIISSQINQQFQGLRNVYYNFFVGVCTKIVTKI